MAQNADRRIVRGIPVGGTKAVDVHVQDGTVTAVRRAGKARPNAGSATSVLAPTLFDIQVNGVGGINLQGHRVTAEDAAGVSDYLAQRGVSLWVPTLITGSLRDMTHGCRAFAEALQDKSLARAVPGIHLEGPHISPVDGPRGAHPKRQVRKPSLRELDRMQRAADGKVLYVTIAPEMPGAVPYIRGCVKRGITVSLGHHHGTADDVNRAVDAGARLSTHLGNGLMVQLQRHFNPIWPQLANDGLAASLIADLHHLPREVLKTFVRAKGPSRTVLTSDCVHVAGLKPGQYDLGGHPIELTRAGRINLSGTDLLAGSALMLLEGVINAARETDLTLAEAFASASTVPAKLLGVRRRFALPKVGQKADFIAYRVAGGKPKIQTVFINGKQCV